MNILYVLVVVVVVVVVVNVHSSVIYVFGNKCFLCLRLEGTQQIVMCLWKPMKVIPNNLRTLVARFLRDSCNLILHLH